MRIKSRKPTKNIENDYEEEDETPLIPKLNGHRNNITNKCNSYRYMQSINPYYKTVEDLVSEYLDYTCSHNEQVSVDGMKNFIEQNECTHLSQMHEHLFDKLVNKYFILFSEILIELTLLANEVFEQFEIKKISCNPPTVTRVVNAKMTEFHGISIVWEGTGKPQKDLIYISKTLLDKLITITFEVDMTTESHIDFVTKTIGPTSLFIHEGNWIKH